MEHRFGVYQKAGAVRASRPGRRDHDHMDRPAGLDAAVVDLFGDLGCPAPDFGHLAGTFRIKCREKRVALARG